MDWLDDFVSASLTLIDAWLYLETTNSWGPCVPVKDPVMTETVVAAPPDTVPVFPPEWPQDLADDVLLLWLARRKVEEESAQRLIRLQAALIERVAHAFGPLTPYVEIDWSGWPSGSERRVRVRLPGCKPLSAAYGLDGMDTWTLSGRWRLHTGGAPTFDVWSEAVLAAWEAEAADPTPATEDEDDTDMPF